jgi:hypothetical protein
MAGDMVAGGAVAEGAADAGSTAAPIAGALGGVLMVGDSMIGRDNAINQGAERITHSTLNPIAMMSRTISGNLSLRRAWP